MRAGFILYESAADKLDEATDILLSSTHCLLLVVHYRFLHGRLCLSNGSAVLCMSTSLDLAALPVCPIVRCAHQLATRFTPLRSAADLHHDRAAAAVRRHGGAQHPKGTIAGCLSFLLSLPSSTFPSTARSCCPRRTRCAPVLLVVPAWEL
jgi:hypothetical protein